MYAQNRDTALGNRDRIRQAAMTYRLKLEELIKNKLGGRLTDVQMEQALMDMVKELSASLNIPLRTGSRPPNPAAWEYWKQNLECKGGERFSNCLNKCVPSYQPEPQLCHPFPRPYPTPLPIPIPPPSYPYPLPRPYPYPRPPFIPRHPWQKYPWQRYPWQRYPWQTKPWQTFPGQTHPAQRRPGPGFRPPFPRPGPGFGFGCRPDRRKCSRKYRGSCTRECRKRWGGDCRGCQCACHGMGGGRGGPPFPIPRPGWPVPRPIPFAGGARAYSTSNIYGKIHRKLGRKLCRARCKMIRGRGRGDCEKACRRHRFPRPPFPGPFPPMPVPLPMPMPPFPVPPPYEIPVPPPFPHLSTTMSPRTYRSMATVRSITTTPTTTMSSRLRRTRIP